MFGLKSDLLFGTIFDHIIKAASEAVSIIYKALSEAKYAADCESEYEAECEAENGAEYKASWEAEYKAGY